MKRNPLAIRTTLAFGIAAANSVALAQITGPSSSTVPYVLPFAPGVKTVSILTVGDSVNNKPDGSPYAMVGIPDGLGADPNGQGTFRLFMNHELRPDNGIPRAHGQKGAFVSDWLIQSRTLRVIRGEDLIRSSVVLSGTSVFNRFCSGDLPARGAFYDAATKTGTKNLIYMNGEESGVEGRAFGHVATGPDTGTSYELPCLGKFSWENSVTHPSSGQKTIVIGTDDSTPGQVYVYVGEKQNTGNDIEQAGLEGGSLFAVKVPGVLAETRAGGIGGASTFEMYGFGEVSTWTGAALQAASDLGGVTTFLRPEDGAWDPSSPNDFYFVTTDQFSGGRSRLWRLRFADIQHPELGGQIDMLLDGTEGQKMMDNMTIDGRGRVIIQEDVGNNAHLGKILVYDVATDVLTTAAGHNPDFFDQALATHFLTQDEEASGIIPAPFIGPDWFLMDVQAHYSLGGELVEGGQLLAIYIP